MVLSSLQDVNSLIDSKFEEDVYGSTDVELDCLLPTGIYIPLCVDRWSTVSQVKQKLWAEAQEYPLHADLKEQDSCVFVFINSFGEREEISDEGRQISTIQPFLSLLQVIRKVKRNVESDINTQIGSLIGKHDFESLRDEEIIEFRSKSRQLCDRINDEKGSVRDLNQLISFKHPPDVCEDVDLWQRVSEALSSTGNKFMIEIPHEQVNGNSGTHRLFICADKYPDDVIHGALQKQVQSMNPRPKLEVEDYVLKIVGRDEYLLPDQNYKPRPLYKYSYIYRKIMKQENPKLIVQKKTDVTKPVPRPRKGSSNVSVVPTPRTIARRATPKHVDLWQIGDKFFFKVIGASKISCEDDATVYLKAAIYHGVETICDMHDTPEVSVKENQVEFNHKLEFDLAVCDLPRMSRLCMSLYMRPQKASKSLRKTGTAGKQASKEFMPLAWVNMCVFDFKARLSVGHINLHMWPYDESAFSPDSVTNHLGTVVSNPQTQSAVSLVLRFSRYGQPEKPIVYPTLEKVIDCAAKTMDDDSQYGTIGKFAMTEEEARLQLHELLDNRDPLDTFHDQEKEQIWAMKMDVSNDYRNSLPKLLSCVQWNSHRHVAQMQALLQSWPAVSTDTALELLDCMYPDQSVRHFAVKCLRESISDTELCRYLLQLVQALKFESYLQCDLVLFLLERAIKNRKLGHYLFWLVKSEMHVPSVSVRFGLILEAYCKGSPDHVAVLKRQDDTVSKLLAINRLVKSEVSKEKGLKSMREILEGYKQSEALTVSSSPLDPALRLAGLKVNKCKYMDSKMKPLWLVWENADKFGEDIQIIFKNGDDLRQDMLTLQVLHIMDNIWISQGLDLRMNPYDCLSTGRDIGMLEVVQQANTIANIQKLYAIVSIKSAFNRESLYRWLQQMNPDPNALEKAVNEFTLSCAGYCVASYVIGIGDRHSDNIMLKKTGQLFHIDFGHFLGNFKSKFGIRRERVPFVLTHDFMFIISKNTMGSKPFDVFKELCERAFLLLRKKGNLLISLFMMMLSTGIPELRSVSDLKYLQDTLKLDLADDKALKHFRGKFKEALNNSWKTSINWAIHNAARNNV